MDWIPKEWSPKAKSLNFYKANLPLKNLLNSTIQYIDLKAPKGTEKLERLLWHKDQKTGDNCYLSIC